MRTPLAPCRKLGCIMSRRGPRPDAYLTEAQSVFIAVRYEKVDACHQHDKTLPCGRAFHVVLLELRTEYVLSNRAGESILADVYQAQLANNVPFCCYSITVHLSTTSCWLFVSGCYRCLPLCCLLERDCYRCLPSSALLVEHYLPSAYNRCRSHVCVYLCH